MTEISARAERVQAIVEGHHGRVLSRKRHEMEIEVPADVSIGLNAIWGMGGFLAVFKGQTTRLAPRRIIDTQGNSVVCHGDLITCAFYRFTVDLRPRATGKAAPSPADITATPTPAIGA